MTAKRGRSDRTEGGPVPVGPPSAGAMVPDDLGTDNLDHSTALDRSSADLVTRLVMAGYSPVSLAQALDIPVERVLAALPEDVARGIVADDEMLRRGVRMVAWRVVSEMMTLLDRGSPPVRLAVIKALGPKLAAMLQADDEDRMADLRADFERLVRELAP